MGRNKIKIERIDNERIRQVTFYKRKRGLIKKSMELSLLCDAKVLLCVIDPREKMSVYYSDAETVKLVQEGMQKNEISKEFLSNLSVRELYTGAKPVEEDKGSQVRKDSEEKSIKIGAELQKEEEEIFEKNENRKKHSKSSFCPQPEKENQFININLISQLMKENLKENESCNKNTELNNFLDSLQKQFNISQNYQSSQNSTESTSRGLTIQPRSELDLQNQIKLKIKNSLLNQNQNLFTQFYSKKIQDNQGNHGGQNTETNGLADQSKKILELLVNLSSNNNKTQQIPDLQFNQQNILTHLIQKNQQDLLLQQKRNRLEEFYRTLSPTSASPSTSLPYFNSLNLFQNCQENYINNNSPKSYTPSSQNNFVNNIIDNKNKFQINPCHQFDLKNIKMNNDFQEVDIIKAPLTPRDSFKSLLELNLKFMEKKSS